MPGQEDLIRFIDLPQNLEDIQQLREAFQAFKDDLKSFSGVTIGSKNSSSLSELRANQAALAEASAKAKAAELELEALRIKHSTSQKARTQEEIKNQVALNIERAKNIASVKDEINSNNAAAESINKKRIQLKQLQAQYDSLSGSQRNQKIGEGLLSNIQALDKELKSLESSTGRNQRKVGDYVGAISILDKALTEVKGKIDQLNKTGQSNGATMEKLQQEASLLTTLTSQQAKGFSSLAMEVRNGERALQSMRAAGLEDSEAFQEMRLSIAATHRELNEFNKGQRILESADPTLKAATIAAKGLAGAYAVGAGTAALFADGDEKVQKELQKLVAVMTIMQGLQEAAELLHQRNAIAIAFEGAATRVAAFANRVWAATMVESAVATIALRIALIALTGGLLLLLPIAVMAFSKIAESAKDYKLRAEELNAVNEKAADIFSDNIEKLAQLKGRFFEASASAAQKKEVMEALNKEFGEYGIKLKNTSETEDFLVNKTPVFIKMLDLKAKATAAFSLATDEYKKALIAQTKADEEFVSTGETIWQATKSTFSNLFGGIDTFAEDAGAKMAKTAKKNKDEEIKISKEKYDILFKMGLGFQNEADNIANANGFNQKDKQSDEAIKKEIEAQAKLYQLRLQAAIDYQKILADEKNNTIGSRLEAYKLLTQLEKQQVEGERDLKLKNTKLTEGERAVIIEEADEQITKYQVENIGRLAQIRFDAANNDKILATENAKELEDIAAAHYKALEDIQKAAFDRRQHFIDDAANIELTANDREYFSGKIDKKKHAQNAEKIQYNQQLAKLTNERDRAKAAEQLDPNNAALQAGSDAAEQNLSALQLKHQMSDADKLQAHKDRLRADEIQGIQEVGKTVESFVNGAYEKQINLIQRQIDKNNILKEKETQNIARSTLSIQEKAEAQILLDAKVATNNEALQRRQRDLKVKEAQFSKIAAMLEIAEKTAIAIMSAASIPGYGIAEGIAIAGIGLAQEAAIAAKPVPTYNVGTENHPGGVMLVHPGEMIVDPEGNISLTPDAPQTLMYGKPGTKVFTAPETTSILEGTVNRQILNEIYRSTVSSINTDKKLDEIKQVIQEGNMAQLQAMRKKQPIHIHNHFDPAFYEHLKNVL